MLHARCTVYCSDCRLSYSQINPLKSELMHVEAVRKDAAPSRTGLVQDYMKIECPQCWAAYHLYHDGMEMKVLRGYFLRANWQISGEHPDHNPVIVLENSSTVTQEKAS
jgi:hypothetical protein